MEPVEPPTFLDVEFLLESSKPQPRIPWYFYMAGGFAGVMLIGALGAQQFPQPQQAIEVLVVVAIAGVTAATSLASFISVRALRADRRQVEEAAELVQLRRWPQAGVLLERFLSHPSPTFQMRLQALVYLAAVLTRYHRFTDAIAVQTHLLESEQIDGQTMFALRLGRVMAMLREDHLFDADRAISELRRTSGSSESAGLALVEIYRDVKTGHPAEAIEEFESKLSLLRENLGHRLGDAYVLAARGYDLLGRNEEAADCFEKATLLAPMGELFRRYPEAQKLAGRFRPAPAPPEAS